MDLRAPLRRAIRCVGGEGNEPTPHRTATNDPSPPLQAGGGIIESRSHVHASIWVYPSTAEPLLGVPPCGGSHPAVTLWTAHCRMTPAKYHPHLWGTRFYLCLGAGNARKFFLRAFPVPKAKLHICVTLPAGNAPPPFGTAGATLANFWIALLPPSK